MHFCKKGFFANSNKKPPIAQTTGEIVSGVTPAGVPERIRTSDLPLRRRSLYPAELRKHLTLPLYQKSSQKSRQNSIFVKITQKFTLKFVSQNSPIIRIKPALLCKSYKSPRKTLQVYTKCILTKRAKTVILLCVKQKIFEKIRIFLKLFCFIPRLRFCRREKLKKYFPKGETFLRNPATTQTSGENPFNTS